MSTATSVQFASFSTLSTFAPVHCCSFIIGGKFYLIQPIFNALTLNEPLEHLQRQSPSSYVPANDPQRLAALRRYQILYTPAEKTFDEIAVLLADTFEVSMAFLSLVDEHKVFFKSKMGSYAGTEVKRNNSFCSLSILQQDVTVFEDTRTGAVTEKYPDFVLPKGILFYAGAPIITEDGFPIGTVCIAHNQPRQFSKKEERLLQQFARLAMKEIENRRAAFEQTSLLEEKVSAAVQKLKQYEAESQAFNLYKQAPVAISLYSGEELIISFANETALQLSGKTTEILGQRLVDVLPEVVSQGYIELLKKVYKTGERYEASEAPIILNINGQPKDFYFNFIYQPYYNSFGVIEGVLAFGVDITEQVNTRKAIEKSEQKFRNVIGQAPYPILILKGEELVLEVANPPLFKLWNIDETSLGLPFLQILPEMKEQVFIDLLQTVYRDGKVHYGYESPAYFLRNGKKELYYFNFVYHPYTEKDGQISGVLILATDVTDQVKARKKTEVAEEKLRMAVQSAGLGTYEIDLATDEIITSERFNQLWGLQHTLTRSEFVAALHPDDQQALLEANRNANENGGLAYESRVVRPDGSQRWVRITGKNMTDSNRKPLTLIGVVQDITEQKQFAEELAKQVKEKTLNLEDINKELQRSNANLEEFAHAASHDLKEPIRKIHFFTHRLKEQLSNHLNENEIRSFSRIESATKRMGNLIDDLLLYSHVSQRPQETEAINLNEKLQQVLEDLELTIEEKGAIIQVGQLPVVQGHRRQLQQLFQNLLSNALKYSKADLQPVIDITADTVTEKEQTYHVISIRDNGIGFEQQYAERIFQMFSRLHGRNEYSGTGVGLSIAKKVVENHNGFIRVQSVVGEGSTFMVFLPEEQLSQTVA